MTIIDKFSIAIQAVLGSFVFTALVRTRRRGENECGWTGQANRVQILFRAALFALYSIINAHLTHRIGRRVYKSPGTRELCSLFSFVCSSSPHSPSAKLCVRVHMHTEFESVDVPRKKLVLITANYVEDVCWKWRRGCVAAKIAIKRFNLEVHVWSSQFAYGSQCSGTADRMPFSLLGGKKGLGRVIYCTLCCLEELSV